jgi:protein-tyrosine phosphatase
MICAYLLMSGHCVGANEAIRLFTSTRSEVSPDLFLRSHMRYLNYYEKILKEGQKPSSLLIMTKIVIRSPPANINPLSM